MNERSDLDKIRDEAVGQAHEPPPPDAVKEREKMSPEEAARRNAPAPGAQASLPEKTAASVGERVGDAYSDAGSVRQQQSVGRPAATDSSSQESMTDRVLSAGRQAAQGASDQWFVSLIAAFGLGFIAAVLLQGRR